MVFENSVLFDDCCFFHNRANIGSAIEMTPNIFHKLFSEYSIIPTFKNCMFLKNYVVNCSVIYNDQRKPVHTWNSPGLGMIHTSHQDIHFQGHKSFKATEARPRMW